MKGKDMKQQLTKTGRTLPRRVVSILMSLTLVALMFPAFELHAHAGGSSDYELDGKDYHVEWDDEHGVGTVYVQCEYCGHYAEESFSDGDHAQAAADTITYLFPHDCDHCKECAPDWHCGECGGCMESGEVPECSSCGSILCADCHLEDYYCSVCGECRLESTKSGIHLTGHHELALPGLESLCENCWDDIEYCVACNNVVSVGPLYNVAEYLGEEWCENCQICRTCYKDDSVLTAHGHCKECGSCGDDLFVCDDCHLCEDCIENKGNHCPACDLCYGDDNYHQCEQGGEHCVDCCQGNGWICGICEECVNGKGTEFCSTCEVCVECCALVTELYPCDHGYCVETDEFSEHLCVECASCTEDMECDYCGRCMDCAESYHCEHDICPDNDIEWEEHLCVNCDNCFELDELCELCHMCEDCREHCEHDLCPEDDAYEDHICDNCGNCFDMEEFCEYCELCSECCEENTLDMDCDHELCVESPDFADHYCFEDNQCLEFCHHEDDCEHDNITGVWRRNSAAHWHVCRDCGSSVDSEPHVAGNPVTIQEPNALTRTMGIAKINCKICGENMGRISIPYAVPTNDGSPYILSQPKDYDGLVSDLSDGDDYKPHYAAFKVWAYGDNLSYQWYYRINGGSAHKLTDEIGDEDIYALSGKPAVHGAKSDRLTVFVDESACRSDWHYEYWCVVSNPKGSLSTRYAQLNAQHIFNEYYKVDEDTHILKCNGWGCEVTYGNAQPHRFGACVVDQLATTERQGWEHRQCVDCGYTEYYPIAKAEEGHVHKYDRWNHNNTEHWKQCKCGKKTSTSQPHDFREGWKTVFEATEHKSGQRMRQCVTCFYQEYEYTEKLPHTHDFKTLKKPKFGRYETPNGKTDDEYHYKYCAGCTSFEKEKHVYGSWRVMFSSYTDRKGEFHPGVLCRNCYTCGHSQQVKFEKKWPIQTEIFSMDTASGWGGAIINGPTSANAGERVTLTITMLEGFVPDLKNAPNNGWSLNEVTGNDGLDIRGIFVPYQNQQGGTLRNTFTTDATTYTATFTMPDGPIALGFFTRACDHKGCRLNDDTIAPSCTGYGMEVQRCSKCSGVVKELSRIDPKGHEYRFVRWIEDGDCYSPAIYLEKCLDCGKEHEHDDGKKHRWQELDNAVPASCFISGHKQDHQCLLCGEISYGDPIKAPGTHNWGDWVILKEPTVDTKGFEERQCKHCGVTQSRVTSYVGDDYELSPDKKLVEFDFTYGDEVEPQYVTFTSVGKNEIKKITGIDLTEFGQDCAYTAEIIDNTKVKITANMNSVWDYDGAEETLVITGIDADGAEFTAPTVAITSNIRKSPEKYSLSIEGGGTAEWEKTYTTRKSANMEVNAGNEVKISYKDRDDFHHWEVKEDASGLIRQQLEAQSGIYSNSNYIMMPQNGVTLRAVTKSIREIRLDNILEPVIGCTPGYSAIQLPSGATYTVNEYTWVCADNGKRLTSSDQFESGKKYYAEFYIKPRDTYLFNESKSPVSVYINGDTKLVDPKWTKPYSQREGWYLVTTNDISAVSSRNVANVEITVGKPKAGSTLTPDAIVTGVGAKLANSRVRVSWYDLTDGSSSPQRLSSSAIAEEGHIYKVEVSLSTESGYRFVYGSSGTKASVNGNETNSFTGSETSAKASYTFVPDTKYELWLGGVQVDASNMSDILKDGGKAKFNPVTNTLTLSDPVISGAFVSGTNTYKIYSSSIDLTVNGSCHMTSADTKYGISVRKGDLTLNGDFAFKGTNMGIYCSDTLTVSGGSLYAEGEQMYGIARPTEMIIGSGVDRVEAKSSNSAVYTGGLTVAPELSMTAPKNGVEKYGKVYESDGETLARHVLFEKYLPGDADGDGKVTISDATTVQKHVAQIITLEGNLLKAADANGDGKVDISDATQIQKYIAQIIDHLG